jgi:hypothetical protein
MVCVPKQFAYEVGIIVRPPVGSGSDHYRIAIWSCVDYEERGGYSPSILSTKSARSTTPTLGRTEIS